MNRDLTRNWLIRNTGLEPALLKGATFDRLIEDRLKLSGLSDEAAYIDRLGNSSRELERLIESVAVRETWFFRYPKSFEQLADHLAKLRSHRSASSTLRMLSMGCSTGEEACSMAITALHAGWRTEQIVLDAIDISSDRIAEAQRGAYSVQALRNEPPAWAERWLAVVGYDVHVAIEAISAIRYRRGDVLDPPGHEISAPYEVIFCRNLLIYLSEKARKKLVPRLAALLSPDGLLFTGHAERLIAFEGAFEPVPFPHAFALRRITLEQAGVAASRGALDRSSSRRKPRVPQKKPDSHITAPQTAPLPLSDPPMRVPALDDARALADRGELDEARRVAESVLAANGPSAAALELLGSVQTAMGRMEEARDCFRKVVYLAPEHEEALLQLALIADDLGEADQAEQYRRRAERAHRNSTVTEHSNHDL